MKYNKFIHKVLTFILLCFYLISTSGLVVYYHFCSDSNQPFYSVYVDNTEDYCKESAIAHQHTDTCCCHADESQSCCHNHNTSTFSARLIVPFYNTDTKTVPHPVFSKLFIQAFTILNLSLYEEYNSNTSLYIDTEARPIISYGKELHIKHQSLKLDSPLFA